ncbi:hypothetical protein KCU73_g4270, partial [Aureobasidium melanogenum]
MYDALTMTLPTDRSIEDEERVINGVKALVDATTDPPKEQSEKLANSIQRSMSEVIQLAFRRADISEAVIGDIWRVPRIPRHDRSDIERISAMIRINSSVRVNERTQYRISKNSIGPLIRETYQDSSSIAHGTFEIRTISRKTANGRKVSLESVITFTANRTQYREFLLSMHLMQLYGSQSATVMPATIIMHEKISYNHPIFQAIIQGNYNTFTKLIHDRSARIWDRDPEGRSLLIYAITFGQVDMVRYLVQHGIDVNDRGKPVDGKIVPRKFSSHIGHAARSDMYRILDDARDTWAKLRLLWSRGAMRDFKGNMRSHIFKCTLRRFDVMHRYSDLAQTLDSLLASKVKDSTKHHEQVDLDGQVQLFTTDSMEAEYDLSHDLQDVPQFNSDTRGQDLIYCAVRRALLRNDLYRDWMRRHPQKPSIYSYSYTPFHHLSWFRQKSPILPSRAACPFGSDEQVSQRRDERDWYKRFKMGEWPEMSSQEESIIAHGALVKRPRYENGQAWTKTLAWSPQGEIHVQWSCSDAPPERYDEQLLNWSSDDSVQYSDAADLNPDEVDSPSDRWDCQALPPDDCSQYPDAADSNSDKVSSPPDGCDRQIVLKRSEQVQQTDVHLEHHHAQYFELTPGHHDEYPTHLAQPNKLQGLHDGSGNGYSAPMAPKRRLSLTTEFRDAAEEWKRPRLDPRHLQSFGGTPHITSGSEFPSITDQGAWVPVPHSFREYSASSGLSNTVGMNWDQANVLPEVPPWSYEELNQGVMCQGMMNQGMMDQGMMDHDMMDQDLMHEGIVNEGVANEGVVLEELNIEESLSRR